MVLWETSLETDVLERGCVFLDESFHGRLVHAVVKDNGRTWLDTIYISGLNLDIELNLWEYMAPGKFYLKVCIYTRHLKNIYSGRICILGIDREPIKLYLFVLARIIRFQRAPHIRAFWLGWWTSSKTGLWWWSHNLINLLKIIDLYTSNGWLLQYLNSPQWTLKRGGVSIGQRTLKSTKLYMLN